MMMMMMMMMMMLRHHTVGESCRLAVSPGWSLEAFVSARLYIDISSFHRALII